MTSLFSKIKKVPWETRNKNENMKKIDVIIILGGGIDRQGRISQVTKERLNGFRRNKKKFPDIPVLLSGRWSGLIKEVPKTTEAQAMNDYLAKRGVNPRRIYLETKSFDTIGNAVFSKQIIMEKEKRGSWKRILLVTSDWHMRRALWIFRRILGKNYQITPLSVATNKSVREQWREYEKYFFTVAKRFLRELPVKSEELVALLREGHPFYSRSQKAKKLLEDIIIHKKEMSV